MLYLNLIILELQKLCSGVNVFFVWFVGVQL